MAKIMTSGTMIRFDELDMTETNVNDNSSAKGLTIEHCIYV